MRRQPPATRSELLKNLSDISSSKKELERKVCKEHLQMKTWQRDDYLKEIGRLAKEEAKIRKQL
jgi:hypothetical protein